MSIMDPRIKQHNLPFSLNPGDGVNEITEFDIGSETASPQLFTFKNQNVAGSQNYPSFGRLGILPSTFAKEMVNDISFQLLPPPPTQNENTKSKDMNNIDALFEYIPTVQIREYLPDSRLDQVLDFLGDVVRTVTGLFSPPSSTSSNNTESKSVDSEDSPGFIEKIAKIGKFLMDFFTGRCEPNLYSPEVLNSSINLQTPLTNLYREFRDNKEDSYYISNKSKLHDFPFMLYYALQSNSTSNIYELPCIVEDKQLYSSDGTRGWSSAGVGVSGSSGLLSKVLTLLPGISITMTPWWNAKDGAEVKEPEVNIKLDLINDTAETAMINFIFINTIIPNNKWVQWGILQHSPCLYDIKLDGYNRLFACSGEFSVTYDGVLRKPTVNWINELYSKYGNQKPEPITARDETTDDNLIKIPDVYHVNLKFTSLLPANFNNFIYQYSKNHDIIKSYINQSYTKYNVAEYLMTPIKNVIKGAINAWNDNKE